MTTPTVQQTRALALSPTAPSQIATAGEMADALKAVQAAIAPDLNPHELKLFAMVAYRSGLDPFAKQIYAIKRKGKVTFQTGIDGFRSTAERTGEYDGQDEPVFGPPCSCSEQPKPHPEFASVTVYRQRPGMPRRGQAATAYWHEFKPAPGTSGDGDHMWKKMPHNQLAKCAEALAYRRAFPYVLADIYSPEEMAQAGAGPVVLEHRPTAREAVAARRVEAEAMDAAAQEEAAAAAAEDAQAAETDGSEQAAGDVVDGHATELPAGLSADELATGLETLGVSREYAIERSKAMFPRESGVALTDVQRRELFDALAAEPKNEEAL